VNDESKAVSPHRSATALQIPSPVILKPALRDERSPMQRFPVLKALAKINRRSATEVFRSGLSLGHNRTQT
jgi:hypothetical protein